MERRIGNIIIQSAGGTAGKNANTYKAVLPSAWIKKMGITEENRQVALCFDGEMITISKRTDLQEFIQAGRRMNHRIICLRYYDGGRLCSLIAADYTLKDLRVEDYVPDILKTAFGNNRMPVWADYLHFLEERCIPKSRAGLREYLEAIGLEEYDPLEIIRKTAGRMAEDQQWLEVEELA